MTSHSANFPQPSPEALEQSRILRRKILDEIAAAGGWLSFARFMELTLYCPGLGYYSGGMHKFGAGGDFVTAPELTPLFAGALANQLAGLLHGGCHDCVLEAGAGSGHLAVDLMLAMDRFGAAPAHYQILELSDELRDRQQKYLEAHLPDRLASRFTWCSRLPERFDGIVLTNELLDALPVHIVRWGDDRIIEHGVACTAADELIWADRPAAAALLTAAQEIAQAVPNLPTDYVSEIGLAARAWIETWGSLIGCGVLLLIDYGYPRHEYYHEQRDRGTLMCHYRHHAHTDPFYLPGLQDITAHVDFTAIADAGLAGGFDLLGYTVQSQFLCNCGLLDLLAEIPLATPAYYQASSAVQKLILPSEMGEYFKVLALGRGIREPLLGFSHNDRRFTL